MSHITEYYNRKSADSAYRHYRKTWDRRASIILTHLHHARSWTLRLAAALTLIAFKIPLDGKYQEIRK